MNEKSTTNPPRHAQQAANLLFIHAQTGLHPGSGTALGTVDLPIQRERHTQWPVIPGSTLKGILRDAYRTRERNGPAREDWLAAFGPESSEADKHAGALSLTDARILAFPVRSLKGVFAWVTCPAVLERYNRDLALLKSIPASTELEPIQIPKLEETHFTVSKEGDQSLVVDKSHLVLEEYEFTRVPNGSIESNLIKLIKKAVHPLSSNSVESRMAILHDNWFTHFVRHATEVTARIALNYESKTAKGTALFYEEFLPAETLFYSMVLASASRRDGHAKGSAEIMSYLRNSLPSLLQIGGNETIGKGLCFVSLEN
jgi:CRISPR-associated protein Cmr4